MSDYTPEQIAAMEKAAAEAEKLRADMDALKKERDEFKEKFEGNIKDRDAAKERERKALEEQKQYEAALKLKDEQHQAALLALQGKVTEYETAQKAAEEAEKKTLLEKFPEADRDEYKDFTVEALRKVVKLVERDDPATMHNGKATKPKGGTLLPSKMTMAEKLAYTNTYGTAAMAELIRQEMNANRK